MTNDLFSLVKVNKLTNQTKFWGEEYEILNNPAGNVDDNVLFNLQMARLRILENTQMDLQAANSFLTWAQTEGSAGLLSEELEEKSAQWVYKRILELVNSAFFSSDINPTNSSLTGESGNKIYKESMSASTIKQKQSDILSELDQLLTLINYANKGQVVDRLRHKFKSSGKADKQQYIQDKSLEAEKLMLDLLVKSNSSWRTLLSGQLYHRGQQLIEDGFVFANKNISFGQELKMSISTVGSSNKESRGVSSLNEFFQLYEQFAGNYTIELSDELYDKLQEVSILSAQAKSGIGLQSLLNSTVSRNATSLNELGGTPSLRALMKLYRLDWIESNQESETLNTIANYCLSKSIALTNITKNSIYFTRDGFITATKWMDTYKQMLKFNPVIKKVSNNLLDKANPYIFTSVGK